MYIITHMYLRTNFFHIYNNKTNILIIDKYINI